jgi:hypothetical protein
MHSRDLALHAEAKLVRVDFFQRNRIRSINIKQPVKEWKKLDLARIKNDGCRNRIVRGKPTQKQLQELVAFRIAPRDALRRSRATAALDIHTRRTIEQSKATLCIDETPATSSNEHRDAVNRVLSRRPARRPITTAERSSGLRNFKDESL